MLMPDTARVMNKEDLFSLDGLQAAQLSPDGSKAVYVVSHIDTEKEEAKEYTTIYLLDMVSGTSRKMTTGKYSDSGATLSPDGKTIAFASKREEQSQIYLLPVDGGEAQQLTDLKQGASSPVWSPDSSKIAFTAGIDYGKEEKPDRSKQPYRVTRNVWRFDAIGDLDLAVNNVYVIDVESKESKQLTDTHTVNGGLQWSPDGTQILYTAMMHPNRFEAFWPSFYLVNLEGHVETILDEWGSASAPHWLPDGSGIVFIGRENDGSPIGTHDNLHILNLKTGQIENRNAGMELALMGLNSGRSTAYGQLRFFMGITKDGKQAYTFVQEAGTTQIYRFALTGDIDYESVINGNRACVLLDMCGDTLLYGVDDINSTVELYTAKTDGSNERQLTHINDEFLSNIIMPEYENLHFKGSDGADVEGWFIKPTNGAQAPYPTILWIHGGPHAAQGYRFAFDTHMLVGAGYGVLYVNHRASTGYGDAFSTAIKGDWGNLDYKDLMAGVDYAIELGLADADKLGCCGISGGGNLSTWTIGQTQRFKAAVPQNPVTNWQSFYGVSDIGVWFSVEQLGGHPHEIPEIYDRCSPISYAHNCTTPTLMIQCENDWRCPPEQSEQFYTVLRANGCIVEMLRQPGGSHGGSIRGPLPLRKANLESKLAWFNRYILGIESETEDEELQAKAVTGD
jgi:dipeptidyl aminopeptidase/acylaminoacyl peptidase